MHSGKFLGHWNELDLKILFYDDNWAADTGHSGQVHGLNNACRENRSKERLTTNLLLINSMIIVTGWIIIAIE